MSGDWRVQRTSAELVSLTLRQGNRANGAAVTLQLHDEERYLLAAALLGHPVELLPGYNPPGCDPYYCGARDRHTPHRWGQAQLLWCRGSSDAS